MLTAVSVLLVSVIVLLGVLLFWSPGRPTPFLDAKGDVLPGVVRWFEFDDGRPTAQVPAEGAV